MRRLFQFQRERGDPWLFMVISLLVQYPDAELRALRAPLREGARRVRQRRAREAVEHFLDWWLALADSELEERYVEALDLRRSTTPYLTYYLHGDTRERGRALVELKQRYRSAGLAVVEGELPDHLAVVLEYAALAPAEGCRLLVELRPALALLGRGLHRADSRWALLLDALDGALPRGGGRR